jgi:hypothetical protein
MKMEMEMKMKSIEMGDGSWIWKIISRFVHTVGHIRSDRNN